MAEVTTLIASARWLMRKSDWFERRAEAANKAGDYAQAREFSGQQLDAWHEAQALLKKTVPAVITIYDANGAPLPIPAWMGEAI